MFVLRTGIFLKWKDTQLKKGHKTTSKFIWWFPIKTRFIWDIIEANFQTKLTHHIKLHHRVHLASKTGGGYFICGHAVIGSRAGIKLN